MENTNIFVCAKYTYVGSVMETLMVCVLRTPLMGGAAGPAGPVLAGPLFGRKIILYTIVGIMRGVAPLHAILTHARTLNSCSYYSLA